MEIHNDANDKRINSGSISPRLRRGHRPIASSHIAAEGSPASPRRAAAFRSTRPGTRANPVRRIRPAAARVNANLLNRVPEAQGLYLLQDRNQKIFIGETVNLRMRMKQHLDISGGRMFPEWLYPNTGGGGVRIGMLPLPDIREGALKVMELKAITSFQPLLNYRRTAA